MKTLLYTCSLFLLLTSALGQSPVRRADTLQQVLTIDPTKVAVGGKVSYMVMGRTSVTGPELLLVDYDATNSLAANGSTIFTNVANVGRWVVRPTINLASMFLAGSNMVVSVTSTSVTYSSTGGGGSGLPVLIVDGASTTNGMLSSSQVKGSDISWSRESDTNVIGTLHNSTVTYDKIQTQAPGTLLGGVEGGAFEVNPSEILIGANLLMTGNTLSAIVSSGTNTWSIEVDSVLVLEPNIIDSPTISATATGSDVSFDIKSNSITTNMVTSDIRTLLFTDSSGAGTNLIVNGTLRQPAIITNSPSVTWTINGDGHIVATAAGGSGESTTASNLDTQSATNQGWFKALSGSDLQFRNFAVGPNLTLRSNANSITLDVVISTNSGTVVSVDGGSPLTIINFADSPRIAGTLTTTNISYDLVAGSITSNYLAASSVTQDKLSATGTPTSTNVLFGDWVYRQVTTNDVPGLVAVLESLRSSLTYTNGVTNLAGIIHGNYAPGTSITFTTNAGKVTIASTATGGGGSGTNVFINNVLSQPAKFTNSPTIVWTTNSAGDIIATATNIAGTTTDNVVQRVGYAYFTITNNSTVGDFSYESLGGVITDINCLQCDNDRVGKIDFTFTTLATNYFWTITREGSSAVPVPIGSHAWEDTGLRTTTSLRLFMMDDGGSVTFSDVTGYMFRFNLYSTATVGGSGGSGDPGVQTANFVYAGPTNGSPATPTFRALVDADIPNGIPRLASNNTFTTTNIFSGMITLGSLSRTNWLPSQQEVYAYTEFLFGSGGATTTMFLPWQGTAISSGTSAAVAGTSNHVGIISISSAAGANSGYVYETGVTLLLNRPGDFSRYTWRPQNTNMGVREWLGFHDITTATTPTDGVCFFRSNNFVYGHVYNNATLYQTATSVNVASNTWYTGHLQILSDSSVFFSLAGEDGTVLWSDTLSCTVGTGSTRGTGHGLIGYYTNAAAAVISQYDFMSFGNYNNIQR